MKKFKCLTNNYSSKIVGAPTKGKIYDEDYTWGEKMRKVGVHATIYPNDWQLLEEFILPEKWCVKANSGKEVQQYFLDNNATTITDYVSHELYVGEFFHSPVYEYSDFKYHVSEIVESGYTELTFEQFKKYVLKQEEVGSERDSLIAFNKWAIKHNFMDGIFDELIIDLYLKQKNG